MHACGVSRTNRTQKAQRRCAKPMHAHLSPIPKTPRRTRLAKIFSDRSNSRGLIDWKLIARSGQEFCISVALSDSPIWIFPVEQSDQLRDLLESDMPAVYK